MSGLSTASNMSGIVFHADNDAMAQLIKRLEKVESSTPPSGDGTSLNEITKAATTANMEAATKAVVNAADPDKANDKDPAPAPPSPVNDNKSKFYRKRSHSLKARTITNKPANPGAATKQSYGNLTAGAGTPRRSSLGVLPTGIGIGSGYVVTDYHNLQPSPSHVGQHHQLLPGHSRSPGPSPRVGHHGKKLYRICLHLLLFIVFMFFSLG